MTLNVNLKLLNTFVLVAEHGSFRRAADETKRTRSAVSVQIRQLEEQLGAVLFVRTTRRVELTHEGRRLLELVRHSFDHIAQGLTALSEEVNARRSVVTLASSPTIAVARLPAVLSAFERRYPQVTVRVREQTSEEMIASIRNEEVDFAVGPRVPTASDLAFRLMLRDALCVVLLATHPMAKKSFITLPELAGQRLILLTSMSALRTTIVDASAKAGVALNARYEVQQPQTLLAFAAAGMGLAILPRIAIPKRPDAGLQFVPLGQPALFREIGILTRKGRRLSPVARELAAGLAEALRHPAPPP